MWLNTAKKFLVGQPKVNTNDKRERKRQTAGGLIGILILFVQKLLDAAAFSLRVFLRKNIGERTYQPMDYTFCIFMGLVLCF